MNEDMQQIFEQIKGVIAAFGMFPQKGRVIVGLSGGADSMALTHFLIYHTDQTVLAAHVNHGLRGKDANRDEEAVRLWCQENRIPLRVLHADVKRLAQERGMGLEECGREVRYAFFRELANLETDRIATAHTLSDQVETVLLHLTRGAGLRGLSGIPPVRGKIVRPFLRITREQVEAYCRFYRLPYVTDQTNEERIFARNRIRLDVVPVLESINPAFVQGIAGMVERISRDEQYLQEEAEQALRRAKTDYGYRRDILAGLPMPVLVRALEHVIQCVGGVQPESQHLEHAAVVVRTGHGGLSTPGGIQLVVQGNTLFVAQRPVPPWTLPAQEGTIPLPDGRCVTLRKIHKKDIENQNKFKNLLFHNCINYDTITTTLFFRNRRAGDHFRPAGRGVTKSLKKLFNEAKIEPLLRDRVLLLDDGKEIVWMEGFGPSEHARVPNHAEQVLLITVTNAKEDSESQILRVNDIRKERVDHGQ